MFDINGMRLDDDRLAFRDPRPISQESEILDPPRHDIYDSWDQWVDEMERPSAYTDQLFAQGLAYIYGVSFSWLCDTIPEPLELYLGPGKPISVITLTFRSGGLHYSAARPIHITGTVFPQTRRRDNTNNTQERDSRQGDSKNKEKRAKSNK